MPFPISLSGSVSVSGLTVGQAIDRLEGALASARPASLRQEGSGVRFRGGVFRFVPNWNILVPISTGIVEVSPRGDGVNVRYRVSFTEMLVIATLMIGGFLGPFVFAVTNLPVPVRLGFLLLAW